MGGRATTWSAPAPILFGVRLEVVLVTFFLSILDFYLIGSILSCFQFDQILHVHAKSKRFETHVLILPTLPFKRMIKIIDSSLALVLSRDSC